MDKRPIRSLKTLCRDAERFNERVRKLAWKIKKNPNRNYIPSIEKSAALRKSYQVLIDRISPFEELQERFLQLMIDTDMLLKSLYLMTTAQQELQEKLERYRQDAEEEESEED